MVLISPCISNHHYTGLSAGSWVKLDCMRGRCCSTIHTLGADSLFHVAHCLLWRHGTWTMSRLQEGVWKPALTVAQN